MAKREIDNKTGVPTTGHEWDGIKELDNKIPGWLAWTLAATIVWAIGYAIYYPSIPSFSGHTNGISNYSARIEVEEGIAKARLARQKYYDKINKTDVKDILKDDTLRTFALRGGESAFKENCAACHGVGGQGAKGFPNLADDDWLWGTGTIEDITTTIVHGIRALNDDDTRYSEMPAFDAETLDRDEWRNVAEYVLSLSNLTHREERAELGKELYIENCSSCHAEDGSGDNEVGSPALNDAIWLKAEGTRKGIKAQIRNPKMGMMPAWNNRLEPITIKMLVAYVYSLGGK